jgi:hypothetical protein
MNPWLYLCIGKYPLTISNTWSTTRLFINDGLPEIVDFKKRFHSLYKIIFIQILLLNYLTIVINITSNRFVFEIEKGTISAVSDSQSQRMSQSYGGSHFTSGSQFTHEQKFYHNAEVMPLNKIVELTHVNFWPKILLFKLQINQLM